MRTKFLLFFSSFPLIFAFCPDGNFEFQNNCYFFNTNAVGFSDAKLACLEMKPNGGHLASLHDGFTNAMIASESKKAFKNTTITDFWIGLSNLANFGIWSWTDNTDFNFYEWGPSEPQNISQGCAALTAFHGNWVSINCFKPKAYVCRIPSTAIETTTISRYFTSVLTTLQTAPSSVLSSTTVSTELSTNPSYSEYCPTNFIYYAPKHCCYGDIGQSVNWVEAENFCQSIGGHLPSFHSYEEYRFFSTVESIFGVMPWIGLYSDDNETSWKWTDGTPVDFFPFWSKGKPLNISSCVYLSKNTIYELDCTYSGDFFCQTPALLPSSPSIIPSDNCPEGWLYFESENSCCGRDGYTFQYQTWQDGEDFCKMEGAHLISIHSDVQFELYSRASVMYDGIWTGLYSDDNGTSWKWSDGTLLDYEIPWIPGFPINISGPVILTNGGMYVSFYTHHMYIVCTKPPSLSTPTPTYSPNLNCSDGWKFFEATHSCYGNFSIGNWSIGENYCQSVGGHLTSLHSFEEARFLTLTYGFSWTGLTSSDTPFSWNWSDSSSLDYLPWNNNDVSLSAYSCAYLSENSIFVGDCADGTPTILCKKPAFVNLQN